MIAVVLAALLAAAHAGPSGQRVLDGPWTVGSARVAMPYSPNARRVMSMASYNGSVATYRTSFTVAAGDYAVRFESVNHLARVWIDGREVARHTGTYLPFEARTRLAPGRHTLVVRVDWRSPQRMKAEGWHRTWFNFGGINREVTIRRLGASELDSPGIVTRLERGTAVVTVSVRVHNRRGPRRIAVTGSAGAQPLRFAPVTVDGAAWVRTHVRIASPKLWAPGHPALYPLTLAVAGES